jgi:hypothetical protein
MTAGMGIIQLFLTFLVDGLRAALAAALLIGWPIFAGPCGEAVRQAAVKSRSDAIVVPCGPVEIRFRFEESGLTPRAASRRDWVPADTHSIARPTRWNTRFEVRIENSISAVDRDQ